jgi:hypothetical protein
MSAEVLVGWKEEGAEEMERGERRKEQARDWGVKWLRQEGGGGPGALDSPVLEALDPGALLRSCFLEWREATCPVHSVVLSLCAWLCARPGVPYLPAALAAWIIVMESWPLLLSSLPRGTESAHPWTVGIYPGSLPATLSGGGHHMNP